jgi:hypothetical protein
MKVGDLTARVQGKVVEHVEPGSNVHKRSNVDKE